LITHIYVAKLKPGVDDATVVAWMDAIRGLQFDGMIDLRCGSDLGLREGNYDIGITADFDNAEAWHRYNDDTGHNQIRAEYAKPIVAAQRRIQFLRNRHFEAPGDVRNVTLVDFKPGSPSDQGTKAAQRLLELRCRGMHHIDSGIDLGLQGGNATLGVICDFESPEAYAVYDADQLHNVIRADDIKPFAETIRRVQFELDVDAKP
jgi:hypothetical protein